MTLDGPQICLQDWGFGYLIFFLKIIKHVSLKKPRVLIWICAQTHK